jgi:hypothetical protein
MLSAKQGLQEKATFGRDAIILIRQNFYIEETKNMGKTNLFVSISRMIATSKVLFNVVSVDRFPFTGAQV